MERKSGKHSKSKSLVNKETKKTHNCSECGITLTQYEVSDNLYAGINELDYVCYGCQPDLGDDDEEDYNDPEYDDLTW